MEEIKRKVAFYLCALMTVMGVMTLVSPVKTVEAAEKTKIVQYTKETDLSYIESSFRIDNPKGDATYSFAPNKNVDILTAEYNPGYPEYDDPSCVYCRVALKKKGTGKITVKETYKGKTTKVGTYKVKIKNGESISNPYMWASVEDATLPAGVEINLESSWYFYSENVKDLKLTSSDTSVLTVDNKGNVKTLKAGQATITITGSTYDWESDSNKKTTQTISIKVVNDSKAKDRTNTINTELEKIATAKVTDKNITELYNKFAELYNKYNGGYDEITSMSYSLKYSFGDAKKNLVNYLAKNSHFGVSDYCTTPEGYTITKVNKNGSVEFKFGDGVTKEDIMGYSINALQYNEKSDKYEMKKFSDKSAVEVYITLYGTDGSYYWLQSLVKAGDKTCIAKVDGDYVADLSSESYVSAGYDKKTRKMTIKTLTPQ